MVRTDLSPTMKLIPELPAPPGIAPGSPAQISPIASGSATTTTVPSMDGTVKMGPYLAIHSSMNLIGSVRMRKVVSNLGARGPSGSRGSSLTVNQLLGPPIQLL